MQNFRKLFVGKLLVVSFLAEIVLAQASEELQKGIDAFARGDYETAANTWLVEAYEGSADAQFNLGIMHLGGKGLAQNRDDAIFWFTRAAESGHTQAQYNLGHLYFENQSDQESLAKGVAWWRQASLQGFGVAQYNYARALFYGVGVDRNIEESKHWMDISAASGKDIAVRFIEAHADVFATLSSRAGNSDQPEEKEESNVLVDTPFLAINVEEVEGLSEVTEISQDALKNSTIAVGEGSGSLRHVEVQKADSLVYSNSESDSSIQKQTSEENSLTSSLEMIEESEQVDNPEIESLTVDEFVGKLDAKVEILTESSIHIDAVEDIATEEVTQTELNTVVEPNLVIDQPEGSGSLDSTFQQVSTGFYNDNDWLFQQGQQKFTLQLFSVQDRNKALELFDELSSTAQLFSTVSKGTR